MSRIPCALLAIPFLASCLVVPKDARPELTASAILATQYNFRGMTNVDAPVLQTEASVDLPTRVEKGSISAKVFVNWDLDNDVGDAWFPSGHAGEPSQIDLHLAYTENYHGVDITTGFVSYALQNPDDFPFAAERGETKEVFVNATRPVWYDLVPSLTLHYDFDEVDGFYGNAAVARDFPINEQFAADASVSLGYSDEDQSDWTYGLKESGWADLQGRAGVSYFMDVNTTIRLELAGSHIVDSNLRDWFDLIGIDPDAFWVSLGVTWGY